MRIFVVFIFEVCQTDPWSRFQMANRQRQFWLVNRKTCDLHAHYVHHRYKTDFYKPLTLRESKYWLVRTFPGSVGVFQTRDLLSHFPHLGKFDPPRTGNGFYVLLEHLMEGVSLLTLEMLSQLYLRPTNVCLCPFNFNRSPRWLSIYLGKLRVKSSIAA